MAGQPVVHLEIEGHDGAQLRRFYAALFGWTFNVDPSSPAQYSLIESNPDEPGIGGAVATVPDEPSPTWRGPRRHEGYTGHVTIFIGVPDVAVALDHAEQLGGSRMQRPDPLMPGVEFGSSPTPKAT